MTTISINSRYYVFLKYSLSVRSWVIWTYRIWPSKMASWSAKLGSGTKEEDVFNVGNHRVHTASETFFPALWANPSFPTKIFTWIISHPGPFHDNSSLLSYPYLEIAPRDDFETCNYPSYISAWFDIMFFLDILIEFHKLVFVIGHLGLGIPSKAMQTKRSRQQHPIHLPPHVQFAKHTWKVPYCICKTGLYKESQPWRSD